MAAALEGVCLPPDTSEQYHGRLSLPLGEVGGKFSDTAQYPSGGLLNSNVATGGETREEGATPPPPAGKGNHGAVATRGEGGRGATGKKSVAGSPITARRRREGSGVAFA